MPVNLAHIDGMAIEPEVRADGLCVVCGRDRETHRSEKYGGLEAELDPFCSSGCCREWYGNPVPYLSKHPVRAPYFRPRT